MKSKELSPPPDRTHSAGQIGAGEARRLPAMIEAVKLAMPDRDACKAA